jgi:hypothetical protein
VTCPLKVRIVEPEKTSVTRQWQPYYVTAVTDTHAAVEELLEAVFSVGYVTDKSTGSEW